LFFVEAPAHVDRCIAPVFDAVVVPDGCSTVFQGERHPLLVTKEVVLRPAVGEGRWEKGAGVVQDGKGAA